MSTELFPLKPSKAEQEMIVNNILRTFNSATAMQWAKGMSWYSTAHDLALAVGGGDVTIGAGMIAALSANVGWVQNRKMALEMARTGTTKGLALGIRKAGAIALGEDPVSVLGKGRKTVSFFHNIAYPETSTSVTVDRHAHDVARGERFGDNDRGLSTPKRYDIFEAAYQEAAHRIGGGVLPSQVQAVTWVVWTQTEVPSRYRRSED